MLVPAHIKNLQEKSRDLEVRRLDKSSYLVESISNPQVKHQVTVQFADSGRTIHARCNCAWGTYQGIACSHVLACLEYMASLKGRTLSFWQSEDEAKRQKHRRFYLAGKLDNEGVWITSRSA